MEIASRSQAAIGEQFGPSSHPRRRPPAGLVRSTTNAHGTPRECKLPLYADYEAIVSHRIVLARRSSRLPPLRAGSLARQRVGGVEEGGVARLVRNGTRTPPRRLAVPSANIARHRTQYTRTRTRLWGVICRRVCDGRQALGLAAACLAAELSNAGPACCGRLYLFDRCLDTPL